MKLTREQRKALRDVADGRPYKSISGSMRGVSGRYRVLLRLVNRGLLTSPDSRNLALTKAGREVLSGETAH